MELQKYIDHTLLKATATPADIQKLCAEAKLHEFYAVCVNGCNVKIAKSELLGSEVRIAAVIGFPLGAMSTEAKIAEAGFCIKDGADEIDMVINIGWLKSGKFQEVLNEIKAVKAITGKKVLKVIIETCYLTEEEKKKAIQVVLEGGADFIKTSTGFGPYGATIEDVKLMREICQDKIKIKASGGIKDRKTAIEFIKSGASRIGTSSGTQILSDQN